MQLTQRAGLHLEDDTGHGRGDGKLRTVHAPFQTAAEHLEGSLREQTVLVRERRALPSLQRRDSDRRRDPAFGEKTSFFGKLSKTEAGRPKFFVSRCFGAWPIQSVMLKVPNSEK
jgi:hypothetical protein